MIGECAVVTVVPVEGQGGISGVSCTCGAFAVTSDHIDSPLGSGQPPGEWPQRWFPAWIVEAIAITALLGVFLLLHYSEEGYLRRNGVRATATVTELPLGENSCRRCPLEFMIDGELYYVHESLGSGESEYFYGESVDLYVDPDDMTHVVAVGAVEVNVMLGVMTIVVAAVVAVGVPVLVVSPRLRHRLLMRLDQSLT